MPQFAQWNVGDVILDLYKVTDVLGEGGFGKVYKVKHQGWNIDLAVKIPKPEIIAAAGGVENFEHEAETWVNLGLHPHTVSCYYVRRIDESAVVFAEYVADGSLHDSIESRRLYEGGKEASLKRILDIAIQFAWGLHYAHEQGLIHQDVKPGNVMITAGGVVKVTDFGLANVRNAAAIGNNYGETPQAGKVYDSTLIVPGSGAMTPAYCSPEQANGDNLTRRTDLWSWALSVLEMFQGERTWQHGAVAAGALEYYLESVCEYSHLPQMPILLVQLLRRCFRENQKERPHNMQEVANHLQSIYQQVTGEAYPQQAPQTAKDIADSLNNRAVSLFDLGREKKALQLWEQALQLQPQHPESIYNRGLILWRSGQINDDTLVEELNQVQMSNLGELNVKYLLILVHLERDDCKAAIEILESIQGKEAQKEEIKALLKQAKERLPYSKRIIDTFEGHTNYLSSTCLSVNNQFVLSGDEEKRLNLWEVSTGRSLRTFEGHTSLINSVCLSKDNQFALSGGDDTTLKLWEILTGRCLRILKGHTSTINSVCLSADNQFALSGGDDKTLKLWEISTGRCLLSFEGDTSCINSVCLSADNQFALSGGDDKTLKLWEISTGDCLHTFEGHTGSISSVCLSVDNRYALSGSNDGTLKLWEISTGRCLYTFKGHTSVINSLCLSVDNQYVLSGSNDGTLKLWVLDWELEDRLPANWDEGAKIYLENFITLHTPYAATLLENHELSEEEITLALTRHGIPTWTKEDFQKLLYTLGCAGYGWLRPEGVRQQLEAMVKNMPGSALISKPLFASANSNFSAGHPTILVQNN